MIQQQTYSETVDKVFLTTLRYDECHPAAITIDFDGVEWVLSRDLLRTALVKGCAGIGAVKVTVTDVEVHILLSAPDGEAMVTLVRAVIDNFLWRSYDVVPFGEEHYDIDSWLNEIFH